MLSDSSMCHQVLLLGRSRIKMPESCANELAVKKDQPEKRARTQIPKQSNQFCSAAPHFPSGTHCASLCVALVGYSVGDW